MTRGQNIGKALGLVNKFWAGCDMDDEYGYAMGAPMGELRPLINRGRVKYFRHLKRRVKAITGLRWRVFCDEVQNRTSGKWTHYHSCIGEELQLQRCY